MRTCWITILGNINKEKNRFPPISMPLPLPNIYRINWPPQLNQFHAFIGRRHYRLHAFIRRTHQMKFTHLLAAPQI